MSNDANLFESRLPKGDLAFYLPSGVMAKEFGSVSVFKRGEVLEIQVTLLVQPQGPMPKAWKTAVALDASASMKKVFGRRLLGNIPAEIAREYQAKDWLKNELLDGRKVTTFQRLAVDDAIKRSLVSLSPNNMDYLGPEFLSYLARKLDVDGAPTFIYWAGEDGSSLELVGDIKESDCSALTITGPSEMSFGNKTLLMPAVEYLVQRLQNSHMGLFIFFTDGHIEDLKKVKQYTLGLAKDILAGKRAQIKCVLIGIGDNIDEAGMDDLDGLAAQANINIWDHMIVQDFQAVLNLFGEIIRDTRIVAKNGAVYDARGNPIRIFPDGLPNYFVFTIPATSPWFELELGENRIRQIIHVPNIS